MATNTTNPTFKPISFSTDDGRELLFQGVHYNVFIEGLVSKTAIEQKYINPYDTNIEAVYTFPLAVSAILLNIEININGRLLKGRIVEASEADDEYKEAISDGNRAIMVEKGSDGVYTVKVGNILPNDEVTVILEYTEQLSWKQDRIKLSIPTVIAQKYGDASKLGMGGVKEPRYAKYAQNYFTFEMFISGILSDADIQAPSHTIDVKRNSALTQVMLHEAKDLMNKDVTITFDTHRDRKNRSFAIAAKGVNDYTAIASFYPSFACEGYVKKAKSVTFVVDCSGSMEGISIEKAKSALYKAIGQLGEDDYVNLVLFGTESKKIFDSEMSATRENLKTLKNTIDYIDADMGGTEMESALSHAYSGKIDGLKIDRYLFLITDGQVYDHEGVVSNALKSEMAHYIVGVGPATDEALLSEMASKTKGSYENIDPNEHMDSYILNLFKKIDSPKTTDIRITWPLQSKIEVTPKVVFDGDTLYTFGVFDDMPVGNVFLDYTLENGNHYSISAAITPDVSTESPSAVSKMVMSNIINSRKNKYEIILYALDYQLIGPYTKFILTDEVEVELKPYKAPKLHRVGSMRLRVAGICSSSSSSSSSCYSEDFINVPTFMRTNVSEASNKDVDKSSEQLKAMVDALPAYYVKNIMKLLDAWAKNEDKYALPFTVEQIIEAGITRKEILDLFETGDIYGFYVLLLERYYKEFATFSLNVELIDIIEKYRV